MKRIGVLTGVCGRVNGYSVVDEVTATLAHSELQDEANRNVAARAEHRVASFRPVKLGCMHISANNGDEADDNLPSVEGLYRMDIT
jgi:hypothetical protein